MVHILQARLRDLSLKRKLLILIVGFSCFTLLLFSSGQLIYGVLHNKSILLEKLTITAKLLGDQSVAALEFIDQKSAHEVLSSLRLNKNIYIACLYNENNKLFTAYRADHQTDSSISQCPATPTNQNGFHNGMALASYNIVRGSDKLGSLYIESNLKTVEQFISQSFLSVIALFLVVSLFGYFISLRLQRIISDPIFHLVTTVKSLSINKDFSIRANKQGNDELGVLVDAFNSMLTQIQDSEEQLRQVNDNLEVMVNDRTIELQSTNKHLQQSLKQLQMAQDQLVQSEKMASLGGLVAGVAHEINTPVGVGVTAISHLQLKLEEYEKRYQSGQLTRDDFESFLNTTTESSRIIQSNLNRAADLIRSFKQVAVDQTSDELRSFDMKAYLHEILHSLKPKLKARSHTTNINCPDNLVLHSHPGALSQVITNLIMNSIIHGFEDRQSGHIDITVAEKEAGSIQLDYSDNGKGISAGHIKKVFEPFFTTRRGQGGTGLGMHIVYNLVTRTLGGRIHCRSTEGQGTTFQIELAATIEPQYAPIRVQEQG